MSFSYSGDPAASQLDACRFLIGDTSETDYILQDEEIDYMIQQANSDVVLLNYMLFSQAATVFAHAIKRSLGPQSEDPTQRLSYFSKQADIYKNKLATKGLSVPHYRSPKVFSKGMQNNPPWRPRSKRA